MTLVDTSAWIEALTTEGDEEVRARDAELLVAGEASLCPMVALELWNGAGGEAEQKKNRRLADELPGHEITADVWRRASSLARSCRSGGVTVPGTAILIAATAEVYQVRLLHADRRFTLINDVLSAG